MLASSGFVAIQDVNARIGCGSCVDHCQFAAISLHDGHAAIDWGARMGCGVCVSKCPEDALSLARDAGGGEPLEIQALMASAGGAAQAEMS